MRVMWEGAVRGCCVRVMCGGDVGECCEMGIVYVV